MPVGGFAELGGTKGDRKPYSRKRNAQLHRRPQSASRSDREFLTWPSLPLTTCAPHPGRCTSRERRRAATRPRRRAPTLSAPPLPDGQSPTLLPENDRPADAVHQAPATAPTPAQLAR